MHVFIDTNILLNFYHFTGEDLDALNSIFVSHEQGAVAFHITDQIRDEFMRNRETKIKDALKRFGDVSLAAQLPHFMRGYEEYEVLRKLSQKIKKASQSIRQKADDDIKNNNLAADHLIGSMLEGTTLISTSEETYRKARMRMDMRNPPGKDGSIGDAINWLLLLENVPDGEDLYIITEDSDFYSVIDKEVINPFLSDEWQKAKDSKVIAYRSLANFLKDHYDGVVLSFDKDKKTLIDSLEAAGNFATTHEIVAKLGKYKYFSLQEAKGLLDGAVVNEQYGWIVGDADVKELLKTALAPHKAQLTDDSYKPILDTVFDGQDDDEDDEDGPVPL